MVYTVVACTSGWFPPSSWVRPWCPALTITCRKTVDPVPGESSIENTRV
jgi:hypothetical protein